MSDDVQGTTGVLAAERLVATAVREMPPELREPGPWQRRVHAVVWVMFVAVVVVAGFSIMALVEAWRHDRDAITLLVSVVFCLFVAYLAFEGVVFEAAAGLGRVLLRLPGVVVAVALLPLVPLGLLLLFPTRLVRVPCVGRRAEPYLEFRFAGTRGLGARLPALQRIPALVNVVTGGVGMVGRPSVTVAEAVRWPFHLSHADHRPGVLPVPHYGGRMEHPSPVVPTLVTALMARVDEAARSSALLLLVRAPHGPFSGRDAALVYPCPVRPSERDFVLDELRAAGYCDHDLIIGARKQAGTLVRLAWCDWRHHQPDTAADTAAAAAGPGAGPSADSAP